MNTLAIVSVNTQAQAATYVSTVLESADGALTFSTVDAAAAYLQGTYLPYVSEGFTGSNATQRLRQWRGRTQFVVVDAAHLPLFDTPAAKHTHARFNGWGVPLA